MKLFIHGVWLDTFLSVLHSVNSYFFEFEQLLYGKLIHIIYKGYISCLSSHVKLDFI